MYNLITQVWSLKKETFDRVYRYVTLDNINDHVQQEGRLGDFAIQMRVIHYAVVSPFNGSWKYVLASVSSYKTSDNFTTLSFK